MITSAGGIIAGDTIQHLLMVKIPRKLGIGLPKHSKEHLHNLPLIFT